MLDRTVSHCSILDKLGGGSIGAVYKAEETQLKRTVALKLVATLSPSGDERGVGFWCLRWCTQGQNHDQ